MSKKESLQFWVKSNLSKVNESKPSTVARSVVYRVRSCSLQYEKHRKTSDDPNFRMARRESQVNFEDINTKTDDKPQERSLTSQDHPSPLSSPVGSFMDHPTQPQPHIESQKPHSSQKFHTTHTHCYYNKGLAHSSPCVSRRKRKKPSSPTTRKSYENYVALCIADPSCKCDMLFSDGKYCMNCGHCDIQHILNGDSISPEDREYMSENELDLGLLIGLRKQSIVLDIQKL
eukprot:TRINITY_DN6887_c0_g1_i1.p1 TRINITY_DN6887_c0_g1~~TRINITY_DN6887_c0_g1_i1.p1  ORF type:complete len:231 (-),score=19.22 TRINITY_DN6887_c0_g1_i1:19-711(-)